MKAVLINICPKWCELIASGQKTVEVRKTKPIIETPFKVYIYMTAGDAVYPVSINGAPYTCSNVGGKVVIGEFVCNEIISADYGSYKDIPLSETGLQADELLDYADGERIYGWRISDLVIYDKPKGLSEFRSIMPGLYRHPKGYLMPTHVIKRPPPSWQYIEEVEEK